MVESVEWVQRFRNVRVLVIGDVMLDSYLEGRAARLCSEGPVPVVRRTTEQHVPGGAANAAANARALGAEVYLLGLVGTDATAVLLRASLAACGVDDRWLVEDPVAATHLKMRVLADDQYVVRFDAGETHDVSQPAQHLLLEHLERAYESCDVVFVSDYRYGVLSDAVIERLRVVRQARYRPLVVDSKNLHRFAGSGVTVVTPNLAEARLIVDPASDPDTLLPQTSVQALGQQLLSWIQAEWVAITMAGEGVLLLDQTGECVHLPAHPVAYANDVGAGDSFAAALALALGAGASTQIAASIGVEAGAIAVTKRRTAVVHHQELLQRVSLSRWASPPSLHALKDLLDRERAHGRRIVFTNGVFDILHAGHVHFLREARALGDILVVAVNTDESARRIKGRNRPINQLRDRLGLVAALEPVDHVIAFDEDTPISMIRELRPHVHVKGGDYASAILPESAVVEEVGATIEIVPLLGDASTSEVIDRIVRRVLAEQATT